MSLKERLNKAKKDVKELSHIVKDVVSTSPLNTAEGTVFGSASGAFYGFGQNGFATVLALAAMSQFYVMYVHTKSEYKEYFNMLPYKRKEISWI